MVLCLSDAEVSIACSHKEKIAGEPETLGPSFAYKMGVMQ